MGGNDDGKESRRVSGIMKLKYDVYIEIGEKITVTQLIPTRLRWLISYPEIQRESIEKYVDSIEVGMKREQYEEWIESQNGFVKAFDSFLRYNFLLSMHDYDEIHSHYARRQIEVFDSWSREGVNPVKYQERLEKATIMIIGAGGVGGNIANGLVSCGVGKLYVVDGDVIEEDNLARQYLYNKNDIGRKKVDVIAERLNQRGLGKTVPIDYFLKKGEFHELLKMVPERIDLITGFPTPNSNYFFELNSEILACGIPIMSIGEHDIGPLFIAERQMVEFSEDCEKRFELHNVYNKKRNRQYIEDWHPSYLPEIDMVVAVCVDEIIRYITGYCKPKTIYGYYGIEPTMRRLNYYTF